MVPAAPYGAASYRRIVAERLSDSHLGLAEALVEAARVLEQSGICPPLRYAGVPPRAVELSVPAIAEYVAQVRQDRENHVPTVFRLSGQPGNTGSSLFLDFDTSPAGPVDVAWISLADTSARAADAAETLSQVLAEMCTRFGAFHGAVEDEQLAQLYRSRRATERARAAVPPELRRHVPEPLVSLGSFPSLLVPAEFNRRRIPDGVWWINFWDAIQVGAVQLAKIESAGFARMTPLRAGALLLLASERVIDTNNPSDLQALARIVEHLGLRQLQEGAQTR